MKTDTEIINTIDQLDSIGRDKISRKKIKIELTFLSGRQKNEYEKKLNEIFGICGCETGKNFVGIAFICGIFGIFLEIPPFNSSFPVIIGILFLFVLIAAMLGKFMGLFIAKNRFRKVIKELRFISENHNQLF